MTEGGFYQPPRHRKTSIAIVVLLHGVAITALALQKMEVIKKIGVETDIEWIKSPPMPPEEIVEKPPIKEPPPSQIDRVDSVVEPPIFTEHFDTAPKPVDFTEIPIGPPMSGDDAGPIVEPTPPPEPVRTEAQLNRGELQPPYPASEQRMNAEGIVSLRVLIGTDGRVKSAEKVRATSEAFYQATLRHALRSWRFKPATVDGRPIESSKVMTVRFELKA